MWFLSSWQLRLDPYQAADGMCLLPVNLGVGHPWFNEMTTLIAYFSHTGNTKCIAGAIAELCEADVEQIEETIARKGFFGYFSAGRDAWRKRASQIRPAESNPSTYDLVTVGTSVWAWSLSPPVRSYLMTYGAQMKRVAFFCTEGGSGAEGVFRQMAELCGKQPIATLVVTEDELKRADYAGKVRLFTVSLAENSSEPQSRPA